MTYVIPGNTPMQAAIPQRPAGPPPRAPFGSLPIAQNVSPRPITVSAGYANGVVPLIGNSLRASTPAQTGAGENTLKQLEVMLQGIVDRLVQSLESMLSRIVGGSAATGSSPVAGANSATPSTPGGQSIAGNDLSEAVGSIAGAGNAAGGVCANSPLVEVIVVPAGGMPNLGTSPVVFSPSAYPPSVYPPGGGAVYPGAAAPGLPDSTPGAAGSVTPGSSNTSLGEVLGTVWSYLSSSGLGNTLLKTGGKWLSGIYKLAKGGLGNAFSWLKDGVTSVASNIWSKGSSLLSGIGSFFGGLF